MYYLLRRLVVTGRTGCSTVSRYGAQYRGMEHSIEVWSTVSRYGAQYRGMEHSIEVWSTVSRYGAQYRGMDMCSVGQLHADTIGGPGLLNLWILGSKYNVGCFGRCLINSLAVASNELSI